MDNLTNPEQYRVALFGGVAQVVEREIFNLCVTGSNPVTVAKLVLAFKISLFDWFLLTEC